MSRLCSSDLTLIVCQTSCEERELVRKQRTHVVVTLVIAIFRLLVATKEEVQGRDLNLGDRMKAPQRDYGDRLGIVPALLSIVAV
jgi:hypothetical protein